MKVWFLNRFYELMLLLFVCSLVNNSFKAFAGLWDDQEESPEPQHISWETGRPDNIPELQVVFENSCDCPNI